MRTRTSTSPSSGPGFLAMRGLQLTALVWTVAASSLPL